MRKTVLTIYVFHNRNSNRVRNFVYALFRKTLLRNSAHTRLLLRFRTAPSFSNRLIYYRSYRRKVGSRDGSAASLVRLHDSGSSQNGHPGIMKGGRVASRDSVVKVWEEIVEDLFALPSFIPYKESHFKKGDKNTIR